MTKSLFVKRNMAIRPNCSKKQLGIALRNLGAISGVKSTLFNDPEHCLSIEYDLMKNSYSTLENMLIDQSVFHKKGIWQKLVSIYYEHLDTTQRDNALAPPAACCNKSPRRY